jgi:hypothetical protein
MEILLKREEKKTLKLEFKLLDFTETRGKKHIEIRV